VDLHPIAPIGGPHQRRHGPPAWDLPVRTEPLPRPSPPFLIPSQKRRRPWRVLNGTGHRAGQLGESGPPRP
jgi:hypothetical protein